MKQLIRLTEIAASLEESQHALALLALGSSGLERDRFDQFSDLDFFVICEDGFKNDYIQNLDWLTKIAPVAFTFQNTIDGHKLLYEDDVFCEFAVFESSELSHIEFSIGLVVWQKPGFDSSICNPTRRESKKQNSVTFLIGEILTNLYVGIGRFHRGEKLASYQLIQEAAVHRILELVHIMEETNPEVHKDNFNLTRRFEVIYPHYANVLTRFHRGVEETLLVAEDILSFLDHRFEINQRMKQKIVELIHQQGLQS